MPSPAHTIANEAGIRAETADDPFFRSSGAQVLVFLAYFVNAWLCLDLYFAFNTSPALIWIPTGIAVAAMIYGGYHMWLPVFLAQFLAIALHTDFPLLTILMIAAGHALQAVIALALLRQFGFRPRQHTIKNTVLFLWATFLFTTIAPLLLLAYQFVTGALPPEPIVNFGRAWGGFIFSVLILTPLILEWFPLPERALPARRREKIELFGAFAVLACATYFVFWTAFPQSLGIVVIFILPAVLTWFALAFHPRFMALALFLSSAFGIAGTFIAQASDNPLNEQLLAVEIYMAFVAAMYIAFAAVVEERRSAFNRLETLYCEAAAADADKNRFIAVLAHELRNPLAPIVTSLEFLKLEPQTPAASEAIAEIEEHASMIRRLLDDLLDVARLTQSKFKLYKEPVRLGDIVTSSVAAQAHHLKHRELSLVIRPFDENLVVRADPVRLKQIFINLLGNAVKYSEKGGRIDLSFEARGEELCVRLRDAGIGIAPDKLEEIFEPFKQVATAHGRHGAGLGLGLYLSQELAKMHGGSIRAESEGPGTGSLFVVTLPILYHAENASERGDAGRS